MKLALLQLNTGSDIAANIASVEKLVAAAASGKPDLIATPENTFFMEASGEERPLFTQENHPGILAARGWAKQYGIWILLGSVHCHGGDKNDRRTYNREILIDPHGDITATYDKIHLFDVDIPGDRAYRESDRILGGSQLVIARAGEVTLGLSICYDVRFPHLYRNLAKQGAQILTVPSAFTQVTGEAHWHTLLRARAIENGCFVIAPAQTGTHAEKRKTYGHSLVVDPWGKVLADGGTEAGIVTAEIDLFEVEKIRARIPSLSHDKEFS